MWSRLPRRDLERWENREEVSHFARIQAPIALTFKKAWISMWSRVAWWRYPRKRENRVIAQAMAMSGPCPCPHLFLRKGALAFWLEIGRETHIIPTSRIGWRPLENTRWNPIVICMLEGVNKTFYVISISWDLTSLAYFLHLVGTSLAVLVDSVGDVTRSTPNTYTSLDWLTVKERTILCAYMISA